MHKLSIRTVRTASGATAVQVVRYTGHRTQIIAHMGSAHTSEELTVLRRSAERYVSEHTTQLSLFPQQPKTKLLHVDHTQSLGVTHHFARDVLHACARACGLSLKPIFLDLVVMRILEPSSKLRALELINRYFGIRYSTHMYHIFKQFSQHKEVIERAALSCATTALQEPLFLVLYDVTTLYFETFQTDELRTHGFSKDDKSKQPQIVIGLLVTRSGFPLAHEVFPGKTFEGHTMLPILEEFTQKHRVEAPIVVADAAMLSQKNLRELEQRGMRYIVGARLANTPPDLIARVSTALDRKDKAVIRVSSKHGEVVCSFSLVRYRKDRREMERQIERAKHLVDRNEAGTRAKFVKKAGKGAVAIDEALIAKTELLLGIKGYCTNVAEKDLPNDKVIACYHDLWNVEHSFRMSKSDLEARPIFHRKEEAIRAHVLLCFVTLMMGKYLEITTNLSLRRIRDLLWDVSDTHLRDTLSGETFMFRSSTEGVMKSALGKLIKKWKIPH